MRRDVISLKLRNVIDGFATKHEFLLNRGIVHTTEA
jgi:hypothetical protein